MGSGTLGTPALSNFTSLMENAVAVFAPASVPFSNADICLMYITNASFIALNAFGLNWENVGTSFADFVFRSEAAGVVAFPPEIKFWLSKLYIHQDLRT